MKCVPLLRAIHDALALGAGLLQAQTRLLLVAKLLVNDRLDFGLVDVRHAHEFHDERLACLRSRRFLILLHARSLLGAELAETLLALKLSHCTSARLGLLAPLRFDATCLLRGRSLALACLALSLQTRGTLTTLERLQACVGRVRVLATAVTSKHAHDELARRRRTRVSELCIY